MRSSLSLATVGHATSLFLAITFVLCVGFDLVVPQFAMNEHWQGYLPGFSWLSPGTFFLGLVDSYAYGWYFALLWVPLYNVFSKRSESRA
jgi:hypothetical protein